MSETKKPQQNRYLFLFDFDGTLADTFSPSPSNIGVYEAYEGAIKKVFGTKGLLVYKSIGGLKNNAPSELVGRMLKEDSSLITHASSEKMITELLVKEKVKMILQEVGESWPKPFDGVVPMLKQIGGLNDKGINVDIGIVTSGHTEFVEKVFKAWEVQSPNICITDDNLRYKYPIYPEPEGDRLIKPSNTLFAITRAKWLRKHGIEPVNTDFDFVFGMREHVVYFGDDIVKDGKFAENSKLMFALFDKDDKVKNNELPSNSFKFSNWNLVNELLQGEHALTSMKEGESMDMIFASMLNEQDKPRESGMKIKIQ